MLVYCMLVYILYTKDSGEQVHYCFDYLCLNNHWVGELQFRNGHCMCSLSLQERTVTGLFDLINNSAQSLCIFFFYNVHTNDAM